METDGHFSGIAPSDETVRKVKQLLDEIATAKGERRRAAETQVQSMGHEAGIVIRDMLEERIAKSREGMQLVRRVKPWAVGYGSLLFVICLVATRSHQWPNAILLALIPFVVFAAALIVIVARSIAPPPSGYIETLLAVSDKRMIPILLDCYFVLVTGRNAYKIFDLLTRLLPTLEASDRSLLSTEQRGRLNRILSMYAEMGTQYPSGFIVAVLAALSRIGDASSIPYVKRVIKSKRDASVRDAARECLETLEDHAEADSGVLLRAASREGGENELLRAGSSAQAADASQLLRSGDKEKEGGHL